MSLIYNKIVVALAMVTEVEEEDALSRNPEGIQPCNIVRYTHIPATISTDYTSDQDCIYRLNSGNLKTGAGNQ